MMGTLSVGVVLVGVGLVLLAMVNHVHGAVPYSNSVTITITNKIADGFMRPMRMVPGPPNPSTISVDCISDRLRQTPLGTQWLYNEYVYSWTFQPIDLHHVASWTCSFTYMDQKTEFVIWNGAVSNLRALSCEQCFWEVHEGGFWWTQGSITNAPYEFYRGWDA